MPRVARLLFPDIPYHVTQRGNRGEPVFFSDADRLSYLRLLGDYSRRHGVDLLAYCLMTNHVHLVVVPREEDSLHRALRPLHMRHAQRINRHRDWKGHLWQGRYFSSALDESYLRSAIRYVERNPVRAGMVSAAQAYPWSSAPSHCGLRDDPLLSIDSPCRAVLADIIDWAGWLSMDEPAASLTELRRNTDSGLPCGSASFVADLETRYGRVMRHGLPGRPTKAPAPGGARMRTRED